jgi:hypothetical protein
MNAAPSTDKIRAFHAVMAKQGIISEKQAILNGYGVNSTKQLNNQQLDEIIQRLSGVGTAARPCGSVADNWLKFDLKNPQHQYILSLCHQLGWTVFDNRNGRHIADMAALATWLQRKSMYKQPIIELNSHQLQQTIYQLESVLTTKK